LHFIKDLVLDGLGQVVHFIDAPSGGEAPWHPSHRGLKAFGMRLVGLERLKAAFVVASIIASDHRKKFSRRIPHTSASNAWKGPSGIERNGPHGAFPFSSSGL
jgi:hypothetical protein